MELVMCSTTASVE